MRCLIDFAAAFQLSPADAIAAGFLSVAAEFFAAAYAAFAAALRCFRHFFSRAALPPFSPFSLLLPPFSCYAAAIFVTFHRAAHGRRAVLYRQRLSQRAAPLLLSIPPDCPMPAAALISRRRCCLRASVRRVAAERRQPPFCRA